MSNFVCSILAVIVTDDARAAVFLKVFSELLKDASKPTLKDRLTLERFSSVGNFLKAQRERKNLNGVILDLALASQSNEVEKKAMGLLEELQIPTLRVSEKMATGDAIDRKILSGKWTQFMEQVEVFTPRGLRAHQRKLCFIKVRHERKSRRQGEEENEKFIEAESRAVTYDVSLGGCFIVSMEDWSEVDYIKVLIGDYAKPVTCKIAWRLPWGANPWKMPGIGVEFVEADEGLKNYLNGFLKDA
jgi:hypothetical protein